MKNTMFEKPTFKDMTPYELDWWKELAIEWHDGRMLKAIKEEYSRKQKYDY